MVCWKNQIAMLESPFEAKRSAPNIRSLSPSEVPTYEAPYPCVRVSLSGVEVIDHFHAETSLLSLEPPVVKAGSPGAPSINPYAVGPVAPAPTMKSLAQIEPRTPISSVPFVISNSGSYYLTKNLNVTTGDAITINADEIVRCLAVDQDAVFMIR